MSLRTCREAQLLDIRAVADTLGIGTDLLDAYETGAEVVPTHRRALAAEAYRVMNPALVTWAGCAPHIPLKVCREACRLTQAEVASAASIGTDLLSKYETGARDLPAYLLTRFAHAYGLRPEAIVWGVPPACEEGERQPEAS